MADINSSTPIFSVLFPQQRRKTRVIHYLRRGYEETEIILFSKFMRIKTNHKCFIPAVQVIGICGSIGVQPVVF